MKSQLAIHHLAASLASGSMLSRTRASLGPVQPGSGFKGAKMPSLCEGFEHFTHQLSPLPRVCAGKANRLVAEPVTMVHDDDSSARGCPNDQRAPHQSRYTAGLQCLRRMRTYSFNGLFRAPVF